jgi:hypothetical protein
MICTYILLVLHNTRLNNIFLRISANRFDLGLITTHMRSNGPIINTNLNNKLGVDSSLDIQEYTVRSNNTTRTTLQ